MKVFTLFVMKLDHISYIFCFFLLSYHVFEHVCIVYKCAAISTHIFSFRIRCFGASEFKFHRLRSSGYKS